MPKPKRQATPATEKEFTLSEIRAANLARNNALNPHAEVMTGENYASSATEKLARLPEAIKVVESGGASDPFLVKRLLVNALLDLDLAAQSLGVNLNQAVPEIFNEESAARKCPITFDYLDE